MTNSTPPSGPQLFLCPTCGASLPDPGDVVSVRCEYCGSTVLVPPEFRRSQAAYRPRPVQNVGTGRPVVINVGEATVDYGGVQQRKSSKLFGCIFTIGLVLVVMGVIAFVVDKAFISSNVPGLGVFPTDTPTPTPFYSQALKFGSKGTGPGQFEDVRNIAIDKDGNIWAVEFDDGRIQKFDPTGKFLMVVNVPPDKDGYVICDDIAADYAGHIYVVRRGSILIFNAADGSPAGEIPGKFPDLNFTTLVIDPSNTLYAFHTLAGVLDLIKMDRTGKQAYHKEQVTEGLVQRSKASRVDKMAVDGLGNIYMLDYSQNQVYKFDKDVKFIDRFGSEGDDLGMLKNPEDVAVDGQGRVYVVDWNGIEIFDSNGQPLKRIPNEFGGTGWGLALDMQGGIYVVSNAPAIFKYTIDWSK